jgi:hypothetical protein
VEGESVVNGCNLKPFVKVFAQLDWKSLVHRELISGVVTSVSFVCQVSNFSKPLEGWPPIRIVSPKEIIYAEPDEP